MRIILFGATGMVGQGVLRECVLDPEVTAVLAVVRKASGPGLGRRSEKVREIVTNNFSDFSSIAGEFAGYDACLFCLGVSALGMKEPEYRKLTYDLTLAAARTVKQANSAGMTFVYVSGAGTNANGRAMWARVKGETEDALLSLGFKTAFMFRPGVIVPLGGITSKTKLYRAFYTVLKPALPFLLRRFPQYVTTTEQIGLAMIAVAKHGFAKPILEAQDIAGVCGE
jgi:uncharacterized protein YbjT (DUF2867 family)